MPRITAGRGTLVTLALVLLIAQPSGSAGARGSGTGEASRGAGLGATRQGLARGRNNAGRLISDTEQAERLQGLAEVEQDLESTEQAEDSDLKLLERQIAGLVQKRDVLRRSEARRKRELSFLHAEVARLQGQASGGSTSTAAEGAQLELKGAAAAAANQTLEQAIDLSDASLADAAVTGASDASTLGSMSADTSSASTGTSTESAEHSAEQALAKEAALKQQQEEQARKAQQAAAAAAAAAEAQRLAAEEKQHRAERLKAAEKQKQAEEAKRKQDAMAESADDSFKQFMKEEDGEDQQGDSDYEDSANALAGAIGWNRNEIESKADNAVKQLTEAIGGKKVVQSLQGMMAGIR